MTKIETIGDASDTSKERKNLQKKVAALQRRQNQLLLMELVNHLQSNPSLLESNDDLNVLINELSGTTKKNTIKSGYHLFTKQWRDEYKAQHEGSMSVGRVWMSEQAAAWKELPDDEKAEWNRRATEEEGDADEEAVEESVAPVTRGKKAPVKTVAKKVVVAKKATKASSAPTVKKTVVAKKTARKVAKQ